jgi:Flp pilus assembly protein TadB
VRRREIDAEPAQLLAGWALAVVTTTSLGSVLGAVWAILSASAAVAAGPVAWRWCGARAERRRLAAVPELLDHVARELRAGATVPLAVTAAGRRRGPLASDLTVIEARARFLGWPSALRSWAEAGHGPGRGGGAQGASAAAAAGGLAVAADVGGPAAGALEALAQGLRDEHDHVLEARALATQGRLSAVVVGLAPVGSLALSSALDPRSARVLVDTAVGRACLGIGVVFDGLAAWWMRRIVGAVA